MARFRDGTTFLGRYVLIGVVGRGGVSVVYRALDTVHHRYVAIKMLDPTLATDPRAQHRIRREATLTARMRHPSVPRVYDYGDAALGDGTSVAYVVMELLIGTTLTGYLADGPLPWRDAVWVAATIADVLAVAHRRGVVHRDVRPANIMITDSGARILDFGIAVTVRIPDRPFVVAPQIVPRNDFAGPGEPSDDVHALGILLHQMVTGSSPYPSGAPPTASAALVRVTAAPVFAVPGVPRAVSDIWRRCLTKRPADRPGAPTVALDLWALIMPMSVPLTLAGRPTRPAPLLP